SLGHWPPGVYRDRVERLRISARHRAQLKHPTQGQSIVLPCAPDREVAGSLTPMLFQPFDVRLIPTAGKHHGTRFQRPFTLGGTKDDRAAAIVLEYEVDDRGPVDSFDA